MAFDKAKQYLSECGYEGRILTFDVSSATVELAAAALNTEPCRIAKSLTFMVEDKPVMIVCAGDAKISNSGFKARFHVKAKMLNRDEVYTLIGHEVGGVCPFGINEGVTVYLDESLKRFDIIYPACGNAASAVRLTPDELEKLAAPAGWVNVCTWQEHGSGVPDKSLP